MTHALELIAKSRLRWRALDRVVRTMIVNWALGMAVGALCALLLLFIDFDGVESLLWRSDVRLVGTAMLLASFAFTFGGLVAAAAAMRIGQDDDDDEEPRGGLRGRESSRMTVLRGTRAAR